MTELGRTTALNALLGQILHPRSGSSIGTPMQMDEHGWMKLSAEPALPRPTDYLGSDTGAAMDLLRHVADERLAMMPPAPAPMAAGPGMACGGIVKHRRMAVGGLVSPLPVAQAGSGSALPVQRSGSQGGFGSPLLAGSSMASVRPQIGGALDAPPQQLPPIQMDDPAPSTGVFSGGFASPVAAPVARVGGTPTAGGGRSGMVPPIGSVGATAPGSGYTSASPLGVPTPVPGASLATEAGTLPTQPGGRHLKSPYGTGAIMADGGFAGDMADGDGDQEGKGDQDSMGAIGRLLMGSGAQLMQKSRGVAEGGLIDAAVAATGAKMAAAAGPGPLAPGDVYSPGDPMAAAPDELPIEGGGLAGTTARVGILGPNYQASSGPGVQSGAMRPGLEFTGGGRAGGGLVHGPGDGRSDSIPVNLGGVPGAIADGEYVVPAYAVSALGEGSSAAGARKLDKMVGKLKSDWPNRVRSFGKPTAGGKPMKANGGMTMHAARARGVAFAEGGAKTPGFVQRSQKNIYSRLEKHQDSRPYEEDVAGFTADQLQAFKQARGVATDDSTGYFDAVQGGQDLLSGIFKSGSNKGYDDELVRASLDDFDRGQRIAQANADRKAAGRRAFGSRRAISEGLAAEQMAKDRALLASNLREQGLERRTAAAGQIANLAGQERQAAIGNVALLTGVGNQVQEHDQAIKDAWLNRLKTQSAIVAGTPYTASGGGASKMQGALGGAMAGAGAGAMTGNPYAIAGGAIIGGGVGYFGSKDGGRAGGRRMGRRARRRQRMAMADGGDVEGTSGYNVDDAPLMRKKQPGVLEAIDALLKSKNATVKEAGRPPAVPPDLPSGEDVMRGGRDQGVGIPGPEERSAMRGPPMLDFDPLAKEKEKAGLGPSAPSPVAGAPPPSGRSVPLPVSKPAEPPGLVKKAGVSRGKRVANDGFTGPRPVASGAAGMPKQLESQEPSGTVGKVNPNDQDAWLKLKAMLDGESDASHDETAAVPTAEDKATMDYGPIWAKPLLVSGLALMAAKGGTLSENLGKAGLVGVEEFNRELGQRRQDKRLDIAEQRQASLDAAAGRKARLDLQKTIVDMENQARDDERAARRLQLDEQNAAGLTDYRREQLEVSRQNAATARENATTNREYRVARLKQLDAALGLRGNGSTGSAKSDQHAINKYHDAIIEAEQSGDEELATQMRQRLGDFLRGIGRTSGDGTIAPPPDGAVLDDEED